MGKLTPSIPNFKDIKTCFLKTGDQAVYKYLLELEFLSQKVLGTHFDFFSWSEILILAIPKFFCKEQNSRFSSRRYLNPSVGCKT